MLFRSFRLRTLAYSSHKLTQCSRFSREMCSQIISQNDFHRLADETLEKVLDLMSPIEDSIEDSDISYSQGVININLGKRGCWVINKQTPNKQIWWSSPKSGPKRFEYCSYNNGGGGWHISRDLGNISSNNELFSLLESEMKDLMILK